jgi:hypothetical protein
MLVLVAVEAVVKLVHMTETGDDEGRFGGDQAHIENIVSNMDLLHRDAAEVLQNG